MNTRQVSRFRLKASGCKLEASSCIISIINSFDIDNMKCVYKTGFELQGSAFNLQAASFMISISKNLISIFILLHRLQA